MIKNTWLNGITILVTEYGSESEADRVAEMYGATREKGKFGRKIGIYDMDKDMTVAWACPDCNHQWSR